MMLYLYLASNADNYELALSPTAIRQSIGMARSTYHDQFNVLVNKGYLVQTASSTFQFYETPQLSGSSDSVNQNPSDELKLENNPAPAFQKTSSVSSVPPVGTEINNTKSQQNNSDKYNGGNDEENSSIYVPKVKEIVIPPPTREKKKSNQPQPKRPPEFTF